MIALEQANNRNFKLRLENLVARILCQENFINLDL